MGSRSIVWRTPLRRPARPSRLRIMNTRPAQADDVPALYALIKTHAERGKMILRPLDELYTNLREFFVADDDGRVVGCAATHIFWSDLAELKCVAVHDDYQGRGVGRAICEA